MKIKNMYCNISVNMQIILHGCVITSRDVLFHQVCLWEFDMSEIKSISLTNNRVIFV